MIVLIGAASAQVYIPTGFSTQSGIVRNVPTNSVQLSADTVFTDGQRAFVAAEVPFQYVSQRYSSQGNNAWIRFGSNNQQQQQQQYQGPYAYRTNNDDKYQDLVRYANENRRSSSQEHNSNNSNDYNQWKNSQQFRNNQNENDLSVPFNNEQSRAFSNSNNNNNNNNQNNNGNNDAAGYQNNQNSDLEYQNNNNNNNNTYNGNSNRSSDSNEYNRANRRY